MLYQILSFKQLFQKKYYKLYILFFILNFMIIIGTFLSNFEIDIELFKSVLGVSINQSVIGILWPLFQIVFHGYITFTFFEYEKNNSYEFIKLRDNYLNIIVNKTLILIINTIIFRIAFYLLIYLLFYKNITFSLNLFSYNIIFYLVICFFSSLISIIYHYFNKN